MKTLLPLSLTLSLLFTLSSASAALPIGLDVQVNDPAIFLEVLKQREPDSQKLIYVLLWPAPVETILEWKHAGYEVRMLLPDTTPPELLVALQRAGVTFRSFPLESATLPQQGVAVAAVRTALLYEPPASWRIVSNASYAGLFANLAFLWEQLGGGSNRNAPSGER